MTVSGNGTTVHKSDTKPTPEEMWENLQYLMDLAYRPRENEQRKRWWEEANERLLGKHSLFQEVSGTGSPTILFEATGLHKYGDNHLQPGKDFLGYAREELLDAINQLLVLSGRQRLDENWGHVKERLVANAAEHMFKALGLLEAAKEARE